MPLGNCATSKDSAEPGLAMIFGSDPAAPPACAGSRRPWAEPFEPTDGLRFYTAEQQREKVELDYARKDLRL